MDSDEARQLLKIPSHVELKDGIVLHYWRKQALISHPDKMGADASAEQKIAASEAMKKINVAKDILINRLAKPAPTMTATDLFTTWCAEHSNSEEIHSGMWKVGWRLLVNEQAKGEWRAGMTMLSYGSACFLERLVEHRQREGNFKGLKQLSHLGAMSAKGPGDGYDAGNFFYTMVWCMMQKEVAKDTKTKLCKLKPSLHDDYPSNCRRLEKAGDVIEGLLAASHHWDDLKIFGDPHNDKWTSIYLRNFSDGIHMIANVMKQLAAACRNGEWDTLYRPNGVKAYVSPRAIYECFDKICNTPRRNLKTAKGIADATADLTTIDPAQMMSPHYQRIDW